MIEESNQSANPDITDPEVPSRNIYSSDTNDFSHFQSRTGLAEAANELMPDEFEGPNQPRVAEVERTKLDMNDIFARGNHDDRNEFPNNSAHQQLE